MEYIFLALLGSAYYYDSFPPQTVEQILCIRQIVQQNEVDAILLFAILFMKHCSLLYAIQLGFESVKTGDKARAQLGQSFAIFGAELSSHGILEVLQKNWSHEPEISNLLENLKEDHILEVEIVAVNFYNAMETVLHNQIQPNADVSIDDEKREAIRQSNEFFATLLYECAMTFHENEIDQVNKHMKIFDPALITIPIEISFNTSIIIDIMRHLEIKKVENLVDFSGRTEVEKLDILSGWHGRKLEAKVIRQYGRKVLTLRPQTSAN